jgi:hypothetical protein
MQLAQVSFLYPFHIPEVDLLSILF